MERRGFLRAMLAAGAAPAIVRASSLMKISETLVGTPPAIFVPYIASGNRILTIEEITRESVRILATHQWGIIDRAYRPAFPADGVNIGNTLRIRLPRSLR